MINRRGFLSGLAAALVAPLPERRRVYSLPSEPTIWTPKRSTLIVGRILSVKVADREVLTIRDADEARRLLGWDMREFFAQQQMAPLLFQVGGAR